MLKRAKENGILPATYWKRVERGWSKERASTEPVAKRGRPITTEYAVYRGDELVVMGTAKECADFLGVKPNYIHWLVTPAAERRHSKRTNKGGLRAVRMEDEEDWI